MIAHAPTAKKVKVVGSRWPAILFGSLARAAGLTVVFHDRSDVGTAMLMD